MPGPDIFSDSPLPSPVFSAFSLCLCVGLAACQSAPAEGAGSSDSANSDGDGDGIDWTAKLDHVFPDDHVVGITLDFVPGEWKSIIALFVNAYTKEYRDVAFQFDEETLDSTGARLKGYSSILFILNRGSNEDTTLNYPLKLNFNYYGGPRFHGLDKLSLGNNWSDASYMRERLAGRVYAAMNVPVARSSFAAVTVDDNYLGIYTMVQPIDKRFLKAWYGTENNMDDGNLYKCVRDHNDTCRLDWRGPDKSGYISTNCPEGYDECGILQRTNEDDPSLNDYTDLIHFIDVVNNSTDAEFVEEIEKVFEVDSFLRLAASTIALSSFDSYFGMGNNYYLYLRPDTNRFEMIPWDMNMSYGGFQCGDPNEPPDPSIPDGDMTKAKVDGSFCGSDGADYPLAERILAQPTYLTAFQNYLGEIAEQHLTTAKQSEWINEFDSLIGDLITNDPNYPGSYSEYNRAIGGESSNWFSYNLLDFVERRRTYILENL